MLQPVWAYRNFIAASIRAEFKNRFARSKLGATWIVLQPLAQATIYAVVLAQILGARLPGTSSKVAYAAYLIAGTAAWSLFSEIVLRCMSVFIEFGSVLKKIAFPRMCLPVIVAGSALINHAFLLLAIAIVFLYLDSPPNIAWLALPIGMVLIAGIAFGLGILLGLMNVFMRDVGHVFGIVLQFTFWLTPIVYVPATLPPQLHWLTSINPLTPLVAIYQQAMVYGRWPDLSSLALPAGIAVVLTLVTLSVFRRASPELVDAL
jgi:lipopolysaccharide transport system permease protein